MCGLKSFSIKQPKKGVMQLSAKKTQLLNYLMSLDHGQNGVFLKDFLRFVTATDRIPVLGFNKKIEVFLTDENLLRRSSTCGCGLILYLPQNVTKNMLEKALKEGLSFGII